MPEKRVQPAAATSTPKLLYFTQAESDNFEHTAFVHDVASRNTNRIPSDSVDFLRVYLIQVG